MLLADVSLYKQLLHHTNCTHNMICVCTYICTYIVCIAIILCRCSELTRKDKLCENVRRMQHAKVRLGGWGLGVHPCMHTFPIIVMLMIVCMDAHGCKDYILTRKKKGVTISHLQEAKDTNFFSCWNFYYYDSLVALSEWRGGELALGSQVFFPPIVWCLAKVPIDFIVIISCRARNTSTSFQPRLSCQGMPTASWVSSMLLTLALCQ